MREVKNCLTCRFGIPKKKDRIQCEELPEPFRLGAFFVIKGQVYAISTMGKTEVINCPAYQPKPGAEG